MENKCLVCGAIIPEGRQVCPTCKKGGKHEISKKLTDEEVVKALENQANGYGAGIVGDLSALTLDLIHRQKATIEQQNKEYIELDLELRDLRTENEELKSPKFASWKLKFFNLKDELKKELAEHEEFTKKAKAEIERLTEENEYLDMVAKQALTDYQNTQVQVDELTDKLGKVLSGIKADELLAAKGVEQAVKDTAKEILKWLVGNNHLFNRTHEIGFEKPRTSYLIESDEIEELAEKYGVEVE